MMNTPSIAPIPSGGRESDINVKYTIGKCFATIFDDPKIDIAVARLGFLPH
jgi:hypothetical protein